jgi:hypothetical protein
LQRKSKEFTPINKMNTLKIHIFLILCTSPQRKRNARMGKSTPEK